MEPATKNKWNIFFRNPKDQNGEFKKITNLWLRLDFVEILADNL